MFRDPWPVFVWLCLLYLVLLVSVLRHPNVRRQRRLLFAVSLLCMLLVSGAWYGGVADRFVLETALAIRLAGSYFLVLIVINLVGSLLVGLSRWLPALEDTFVLVFNLARLLLTCSLLLLGVIGLLAGAAFTAVYIPTASSTPAGDPRLAFGHLLVIFIGALAGILGAFVTLGAACAALLFRLRVLTNTVQFPLFLPVFAYVYLPIFAIINSAVWLTGVSFRTPFFQSSVSALLGVIAFVLTDRRTAVEAFNRLTGGGPRQKVA